MILKRQEASRISTRLLILQTLFRFGKCLVGSKKDAENVGRREPLFEFPEP
jgi:hypothetical protein